MAQITIATHDVLNWTFGGGSPTLRIFADRTFRTSGGDTVPDGSPSSGQLCKSVACSLAGTTVTIPQFTVDSTTDGIPTDARYSAWLYDSSGVKRLPLLTDFRLTSLTTPTSWPTIVQFNAARPGRYVPNYYDRDQIDYLLSQISVGGGGGGVDTLHSLYADDLADAVSTIGGTVTQLIIDRDASVAASVTVPKNVRLAFWNGAKLNIASGQTVTINSMEDPGEVQIFTGSGTAVVAPTAAREFRLTWWLGNDLTADATAAINAALANLSTNSGGTLLLPNGTILTDGGHVVPSYTEIKGCGDQAFGSSRTVLKNTDPAATFILKLSQAFRDVRLEGFDLDANNSTTCTQLKLEGDYPNSAITFEAKHLTFIGNPDNGAPQTYIQSLSGGWMCIDLHFDKCRWLNSGANVSCVRVNTPNNQILFTQPYVQVSGQQGTAMELDAFAGVQIVNPQWAGGTYAYTDTVQRAITQANITAGTKALQINTGSFSQNDVGQRVVIAGKLDSYIKSVEDTSHATVADNATATATNASMDVYRISLSSTMPKAILWLKNGHGNILVQGGQDEGFQNFLVNDASTYDGTVTLVSNLIQSQFQLNQACIIKSSGNRYNSGLFNDTITTTAILEFDTGDYFVTDFLNGRTLTKPKIFNQLLGGTTVTKKSIIESSAVSKHTFGVPTRVMQGFLPYNLLGASDAEPLFTIGSFSSGKLALRIALNDSGSEEPVWYYDLKRGSDGRFKFTGNQTGLVAYDFDAEVHTTGNFVTTAGITATNNVETTNGKFKTAWTYERTSFTTMGSTGTQVINGLQGDRFAIDPTSDINFQTSNITTGQRVTIKILNTGGVSWNVAFDPTYYSGIDSIDTGTGAADVLLLMFEESGGKLTFVGSRMIPSLAGQSGKFLTNDGTDLSWGTVAGGGMAVGNAVTGGGANRVLYEDGSSNLAASPNFTYGASASQLKLTAGAAADIPLFIQAAASQTGNMIEIRDSAANITFALDPVTQWGGPGIQIGNNATANISANGSNLVLCPTSFTGGGIAFNNAVANMGGAYIIGWNSSGGALASGSDAGFTRAASRVMAVMGAEAGGGAGLQFTEMTAPAAPAANNVVLYAEDNGAGKTRLMARFPTGAAQQIAIEP